MAVSRILAGAGLLVALCLPAAVVLAVAPKRWPVLTEGEQISERLRLDRLRHQSVPLVKGQEFDLGKLERPHLQRGEGDEFPRSFSPVWLGDVGEISTEPSYSRRCNAPDGRSSHPSC